MVLICRSKIKSYYKFLNFKVERVKLNQFDKEKKMYYIIVFCCIQINLYPKID